MMMVKTQQDDLKKALIDSITAVCRDKLGAATGHFGIEGLLAVTLEKEQVILVNIKENNVSCNQINLVNNTSPLMSPVKVNGTASAQGSPKLQVNGNSSVLCSIVSKSPLVVAPFQIPGHKALQCSTPRATLLQTTQGQTLTIDTLAATKHLTNAPAMASTLTLTDAANLKLAATATDTTGVLQQGSVQLKHKAPTPSSTPTPGSSSPTEPPPKKRLLEEHLTSNLPIVNQGGVISLLDNVVVKKEILSDDEDLVSINSAQLGGTGACSSQALSLDLDPIDNSTLSNGLNNAELRRKVVKSDKMWNQHPVAQLSMAQILSHSSTLGSSVNALGSTSQPATPALYAANSLTGQQDVYDYNGGSGIKEEEDEDTSSYLSGNSTIDDPGNEASAETDEEEFLRLARSILLYKGTFITVHSFCKVSRRTGKNAMMKISSERACWVMQKMNVPAWDEKYIGEYKELRKGTKVFFKCPPDMVNPKALAYYNVPLHTYTDNYYEEARSASFPTKTELLKRILDASPY